jgi:hypothetical protein
MATKLQRAQELAAVRMRDHEPAVAIAFTEPGKALCKPPIVVVVA